MAGWIALAFVIIGVICFVIAADSYYNEEEWAVCGVICIIIAAGCGIFWLVTVSNDNGEKAPTEVVEYSEEYWYNQIYTKFISKYKLTSDKFPRIKGESKSELQARVRNFLKNKKDQSAATTQEQAAIYVAAQSVEDPQVDAKAEVEPIIETPEESNELGEFSFKTTW